MVTKNTGQKKPCKTILYFFGTRPEAIKLAPLIKATELEQGFRNIICVSGQHREMLDSILTFFEIQPDYDLHLMQPNQSLIQLLSKAMMGLEPIVEIEQPDAIIVQGDTTTVLAGALVAAHKKIALIHLEAGLRSGDRNSPFPEEMNRILTSDLTTLHLAPTQYSAQNLRDEKLDGTIHITGNTVVDALKLTHEKIKNNEPDFEKQFPFIKADTPFLLLSCHRRESFGAPYQSICEAILEIVETNPGFHIVYPVHLNPNIQLVAHKLLVHPRIHLMEPQDYPALVYLMSKSFAILTDSGGIQEEAPYLNKPLVVLRDVTERIEGILAGTAILAGSDKHKIVEVTNQLIRDEKFYQKMAKSSNPYGDGKSCEQIVEILKGYFFPLTETSRFMLPTFTSKIA
ncbi:MAG: UDP-N-acetylglucosamine 2-epimerase (non-hydrolyzing) [Bacteroidetes bacterium]|nr:UDP-N-acetylglucosamine 2-epimerase (non-hydrolyzing) [Bacteroidota bacterium]